MPNHIFNVHVHMWSLKEKNKVMHIPTLINLVNQYITQKSQGEN